MGLRLCLRADVKGEGQHFSGAGRPNSCPLTASQGIASSLRAVLILPDQRSNQDYKAGLKLAHGHIPSPKRDGGAAGAGRGQAVLKPASVLPPNCFPTTSKAGKATPNCHFPLLFLRQHSLNTGKREVVKHHSQKSD